MQIGRMKVLLVEDDEDDYIVLRELFSEISTCGFDLEWASTYESALQALDSGRHDVCLLDYRLGQRSGIELLQEIKKKDGTVPIIIVTGVDDYDVDSEAMRAGVADYLVKSNLTRDLLERSIRYTVNRKRTKDALRESEARYRAIVEDQTELICRFMPDGTVGFANEAYCCTVGKKPEEMMGCCFMSFIPQEERGHAQRVLDSLNRENSVATCEYRVVFPNGEIHWQQWRIRKIFNGRDQFFEYQAVGRDITERKKMEEELRKAQEQLGESLQKYSDLYDFAPVGYLTSNREGLILEANLTSAGQFGIERSRLINTPFGLYVAAPDRGTFQSHLDEVFKTNERRTCELRLERPGGPECYVQLDSIPVLNVAGAELCRTSLTDISVRKEAEREILKVHDELERKVEERTAELSENERKFRKLSQEFHTLLHAISDTLILLSPEREVLWTNGGNALEFNETASDAVRQFWHKLLHDHSASSEDCPITRCFDTAEKEVAVVTHNGAVLDVRAFPIKEAEKVSSVLLLVSDITEKMAMQAEAMQAAHLASLGELAAGVAHEINNPINGIINYGQILINECSPESMEKDIGERLVREGERIGRIVKTLLSFSRERREEKRPARVPAILEESIILTQGQIRKEGIDLKIDLPNDLPEVNANFQQIQQGFINIINNARYALNEKYPGRHKNKRLEVTGERVAINDRPYVRIVFYDHGVGISAHELPVLTKPFFSTKPFGKGTGLGLNITQKIIMDHSGHLGFESTKGEFTRVIIDLPATRSGERMENECRNS